MPDVTRILNDHRACTAVFDLLQDSFATMDGMIDPPSSLHRMTRQSVIDHMENEVLLAVLENRKALACLFLTHHADHLYLGKLATASGMRGKGYAKALLDWAETWGRGAGFDRMELQCRVELVQNHVYFQRQGFEKIGETAHAGYDRPTSLTFAKNL